MSRLPAAWRQFIAVSAIFLLGACAQRPSPQVASNPPPVAPGPNAVWHHLNFDSDSFAISPSGQDVVASVATSLHRDPASVATIIGRTDTVGTNNYNMYLSQKRADAVRDALIFEGHVPAERIETRWTGEGQHGVATPNDKAEGSNRTVDIAVH